MNSNYMRYNNRKRLLYFDFKSLSLTADAVTAKVGQ